MRRRRSPTAPVDIAPYLDRLARRIRLWGFIDGVARWFWALGGILLGSLLLDYVMDRYVEAGLPLRVTLSAAWALLALVLFVRWIVRRLVAPIPRRQVALLVERTQPSLADQLVTAVELTERPHPFNPRLVSESSRRASQLLGSTPPADPIRRRPIMVRWGTVIVLAIALVAGAMAKPAWLSVWYGRVVRGRPMEYPRQSHLDIASPSRNPQNVALGNDVDIDIRADSQKVIPESVWLEQRRGPGGSVQRLATVRQGTARFRASLARLVDRIEIRAVGHDARTSWIELVPVDPPILEKAVWSIAPPEYTGLKTRTIEPTETGIEVPIGSAVAMTLSFSKPILRGLLTVGQESIPFEQPSPKTIRAAWRIESDAEVMLTLTDSDEIEMPHPYTFSLRALPDRPPTVAVRGPTVPTAVTPNAVVPIHVTAEDDYGLTRLEWETIWQTDPPRLWPVTAVKLPASSVESTVMFPLDELSLSPGGILRVQLRASDGDDREGPKTSLSDQMTWEVVTAEELQSRLLQEAFALRQRFERVVQEIREATESLKEAEAGWAGAEPDERTAARLGVERIVAILRRDAAESLSIESAFTSIVERIDSNKLSAADWAERIKVGILAPMRTVLADAFPETITSLEELARIEDTSAEDKPWAEGQSKLADLLDRCARLLDSMDRMESYDEVVATLKRLLEEQERLLRATRDKARRANLDLLNP